MLWTLPQNLPTYRWRLLQPLWTGNSLLKNSTLTKHIDMTITGVMLQKSHSNVFFSSKKIFVCSYKLFKIFKLETFNHNVTGCFVYVKIFFPIKLNVENCVPPYFWFFFSSWMFTFSTEYCNKFLSFFEVSMLDVKTLSACVSFLVRKLRQTGKFCLVLNFTAVVADFLSYVYTIIVLICCLQSF